MGRFFAGSVPVGFCANWEAHGRSGESEKRADDDLSVLMDGILALLTWEIG